MDGPVPKRTGRELQAEVARLLAAAEALKLTGKAAIAQCEAMAVRAKDLLARSAELLKDYNGQ